MRFPTLLLAGLVALATATATWAQNAAPRNLGIGGANQGRLNFVTMAGQIYQQSSRHHRDFLNGSEFMTAQELTGNAIANLGRYGLIGRGHALNFGNQFRNRVGQAAGMGLYGSTITNTRHVTLPQFTGYFLNSVANADAALRWMYARSRRNYYPHYARYGRGYGRPMYGYGHPGYSRPVAYTEGITPAVASPNSSTKAASSLAGLAPTGIRTGPVTNLSGTGATEVVVTGPTTTNPLTRPHTTHNTSHSTSSTANYNHTTATGTTAATKNATAGTSSANSSASQVRAKLTAMAQARAQARREFESGGGMNMGGFAGGGGHSSGGGHPGGGHASQSHAGGGHPSGGGHHNHR